MNTETTIRNLTALFEQALAYEIISIDMEINGVPSFRNRGRAWHRQAINAMNKAAEALIAATQPAPVVTVPAPINTTVRNWKSDPASVNQISYLRSLRVQIEKGMTKGRASQLIEAAKGGYLGSVNGFYTDGGN